MKFEAVIDSRSTEVVITVIKRESYAKSYTKEKHDNNYSVGDHT